MNYYNEISEGYDELHGEEQVNKAKIIADKLALDKNDKLLDVGCGNGVCLDLFKCDVTGVDPSEKLLEQYKGAHQVIVWGLINLRHIRIRRINGLLVKSPRAGNAAVIRTIGDVSY